MADKLMRPREPAPAVEHFRSSSMPPAHVSGFPISRSSIPPQFRAVPSPSNANPSPTRRQKIVAYIAEKARKAMELMEWRRQAAIALEHLPNPDFERAASSDEELVEWRRQAAITIERAPNPDAEMAGRGVEHVHSHDAENAELMEWKRQAAVFFEHLPNPDRTGKRAVHEDIARELTYPKFAGPLKPQE